MVKRKTKRVATAAARAQSKRIARLLEGDRQSLRLVVEIAEALATRAARHRRRVA